MKDRFNDLIVVYFTSWSFVFLTLNRDREKLEPSSGVWFKRYVETLQWIASK